MTEHHDKVGAERDRELSDTVDDLEQRVTEERRADDVPGNRDDREKQPPVESDDDAPA